MSRTNGHNAAVRALRNAPNGTPNVPMIGQGVTISLPPELRPVLDAFAKANGMGTTQAASYLVAMALDNMVKAAAAEIACRMCAIQVDRPGVVCES